MKLNRLFAMALFVAAGTLAGCGSSYGYGYHVGPPPPPPAYRGAYGAGRAGYVWTDGYYDLRGGRNWVWVQGSYRRPPHRHSVWVAPRWERQASSMASSVFVPRFAPDLAMYTGPGSHRDLLMLRGNRSATRPKPLASHTDC